MLSDERLGLGELIERHLTDSRRGKNLQLPLADLLRQSVYSRLAGYGNVNDAVRSIGVSCCPGFNKQRLRREFYSANRHPVTRWRRQLKLT